MPSMQETLERPNVMAAKIATLLTANSAQAAIWIIDALANELAEDETLDRSALIGKLMQNAGYEQADALWPDSVEARRAELVARLAGRLARHR